MKKYICYILVMVTCITQGFAAPPDDKPREFTVDGIKVIFKPSVKEIISVRFFIKGGTANYTKEQEGIEALALSVAAEGGTRSLNKTAFATALEKIGTTIGSSTSLDYSEISMSCIKEFWDTSWKLYTDAIVNPAFDAKEFDLLKGRAVSAAKEEEANPDARLRNQSLENAFAGRNYSKLYNGTATSLDKLTLEQVAAHYRSILGKQNCFIVVVGNIAEAELKQKVSAAFKGLPAGKALQPEKKIELKADATIENRDIATNYIRGLMNAPLVTDKEGVSMMLATAILYDRFFIELRTKRSLSYAPGVGYASAAITNPYATFYISTTDPKQSLQVMMDEINKVKNQGFSEKELKDMKESYITNFFMGQETNGTQSMTLGTREVAGDWRKAESLMGDIEKLTVQDLNATFKKYSTSINWTYLGKESAVSKDDFKQPQLFPDNTKISPKK
ncbi:MAG TPA: pitrilysin family protein [Ohtaekwangia sp.]|uniref:M16 family metallopeptidase n=1 Tax=Ohtaekwangia sp. TaxID=2066019 RepID=UPI002F93A5F6